jgi:hypothetical protein
MYSRHSFSSLLLFAPPLHFFSTLSFHSFTSSFSSPLLATPSLFVSSRPSGAINQNEFGKYGVIRDESFFAKQR